MKFRDTKVFNFQGAIRGMRNPLKSWDKSDSSFGYKHADDTIAENAVVFNESPSNGICEFVKIGQADLKLMQNLLKAGPEHAKFMRQITVSVDITAPRYFWSEFDTYHFNTKNSESTMHKLLQDKEPLTLGDFELSGNEIENHGIVYFIHLIEKLKERYAEASPEEKNKLIRTAKILLPEGFLQKRTVTTSYAELRNMFFQRKNHKLPEWKIFFVNWVKSLPYAEELICYSA